MSADDGFTWLEHVGTDGPDGSDGHGGKWRCPTSAAAEWVAMGWQPCDEPEEFNPVVAENLAAQQAAADEQARAAQADEKANTDTEARE